MKTGSIYSISRTRIETDGPGMTTLVSFKGCPLNCAYCINKHCHIAQGLSIDLAPAFNYTADKLIQELEKDGIYFAMTGGGVVFGGGEPLLQAGFIHEVCRKINKPWKKIIETSLNVGWEDVKKLIKDIDLWIVDIKDMNWEIYCKYTGTSNGDVKDNLFQLVDAVGRNKVHIRVPRIPKFNTEKDIEKNVDFIKRKFHIEPEVFTYIKNPRQSSSPVENPDYCLAGEDGLFRDATGWNLYHEIQKNKEEFLSHTREYINNVIVGQGVWDPIDAYISIYNDLCIFVCENGYSLSNENIRIIFDSFLRNELDEDCYEYNWTSLMIRMRVKEKIRNNY